MRSFYTIKFDIQILTCFMLYKVKFLRIRKGLNKSAAEPGMRKICEHVKFLEKTANRLSTVLVPYELILQTTSSLSFSQASVF